MQNILKTYQKRLTNLTSRNRSLLLLQLAKEQFLDLHELDFFESNPSFHLINQLIAQKKEIVLCDNLDSRNEKINEKSKQLKSIARTENFIAEERGARDLYVGYPIVKGKFRDGTVVRCPLIFWPVTLKNNGKKWLLAQREEPINFNRSFVLAYAHFNQVKIEDQWLERSFEESDKNSLNFRTALYELLKESPFEINFNPELFSDKLDFFEKSTKADLELFENKGELKLYSQAVLGIFPQAGSFLAPDYNFLIEAAENDEVSNPNMDEIFRSETLEEKVKEENMFLPFTVDASQENAIKFIKEGKSLVIEGPPGTGKSQVIANLMADFAARGKKVLLVCQKRVALDTVFARLSSIENQGTRMEDFVALIHDFKQDRKALFEKIANQIEKIDAYKRLNQSLDGILLERNFTKISRRIDQISSELQEFKIALFDESICDTSIKNLYLSSNPANEKIDLDELYKSFKFNEVAGFETRLEQYASYEKLLSNEFWQSRKSFENYTFQKIPFLEKTIDTVDEKQREIKRKTEKLVAKTFQFQELLRMDEKALEAFSQFFDSAETVTVFQSLLATKKYFLKRQELNLFKQNLNLVKQLLAEGVETSLLLTEVQLKKVQINQAIEARRSGVSWLLWKIFSKDKKQVEKTILDNKLSLAADDLRILAKKVENRIQLEAIIADFSKNGIEISANKSWQEQEILLENIRKANEANSFLEKINYLKNTNISQVDFRSSLREFIQLISECKKHYEAWKEFLSEVQIESLLLEKYDNDALKSYLIQHFDSFIEADKLRVSFSKDELSVIQRLQNKQILAQNWLSVFQNSLRLSWINHIEEVYPLLRGVSSLRMKQLEEELQQCLQEKQDLSQEILLLKLREKTYQDLTINRLQNVTTYRELQHQVTKRKKIWSVRKLLEEFYEEIFNLIPCWAASPESVSAIFPMNKIFDLIIFDEASQCYAEQGIPAIYRGKQWVVAGDSKQLQPNDLYQIRYDDDSEENPILEIDSLLDLTSQYLPKVQLLGHYRSHSLDLISFSNQYFYKNTLHLLPHYKEIIKNKPSINYIHTPGIWENNCNEVEAQRVVDLVHQLQQESPQKSIGVITFNYKQANLIDELLNTHPSPDFQNSKDFLLENLFIKNIENVQGDERDIIIFSIGYGPNAKGRMIMQFGSLNAAGGKNRLNVAITRAKEQIVVVSSIFPQDLRVEDSLHEGPKLLKKYLEYALEVSEGRFFIPTSFSKKYNYSLFLKDKLTTKDGSVLPELPFADLTVKQAGKYESLVLTDDDLYFESLSAKDAHAYLPMSLSDKSWRFERIWSRNFWMQQKTITE